MCVVLRGCGRREERAAATARSCQSRELVGDTLTNDEVEEMTNVGSRGVCVDARVQ